MKSRVEYSTFAWIMTVGVIIVCFMCMFITWSNPLGLTLILLVIVMPLFAGALFFAPLYVAVDDKEIRVRTPLQCKRLSIADVRSVERYRIIPGTIRTCASGGFMGYWGKFHDNLIGNYTGYWGKHGDCFLITLSNGKKYLLGCKSPDEMIKYIQSRIQ